MVTNNGNTEGLFRGAFMVSSPGFCCSLHLLTMLKLTKESGSVIPTQDLSAGQPFYDFIVNKTGCAGSSDTLGCLRTVPFQDLLDVVNQTPDIFGFASSIQLRAYQPRTDGVFLKENAQALLSSGRFAKVC
jgi:acetylcholinesterase